LPLVIAVVLVAAACADEPAEPPVVMPATIEQLTGAWAVQPYLLDPAIWKRAEDACRLEIQLPPGTTAILVDARGAGVLTVRMTGQTAGLCSALQILGDGTVVGAGGGWSSGGPEQIVPAPGRKLVGAERQEVGDEWLVGDGPSRLRDRRRDRRSAGRPPGGPGDAHERLVRGVVARAAGRG
jgi:hypothetical protein